MDPTENEIAVADEIAAYAWKRGFDTGVLRNESMFQSDRRWIVFWRKVDGLACSGRADEPEGTLHYNMQGDIHVGSNQSADENSDGPEVWAEAGVLDNLDQAFDLLKAWLVEQKDVSYLPARCVRRQSL